VKKYIVFIVFIIGFIFLQSAPFYENIGIRGVSPDLLLIMVSLSALILGPLPGQVIGFITGLVIDLIPPAGLLGISAFTFTLIGYGVGVVGQKIFGNSIVLTISLLFFVTIIKAVVLSMFAALFLKPGYFGYFVQGKVFLEAVLNSLISPVLYFIITKIEAKVVK